MKSRNVLLTALSLGLTLSAPLAFAQDQTASPTAQEQTAADPATPATPAQPADPAAQTAATPATPATPASPAEGETKKITWSDLDADKDGKLTKTEASSVQALTQVFDDADADKDGALTPDEYKAFVAKNQADAAQPQNEG
ncbi:MULTISPECIES: EF-hand domain-containing protein [unclassified Lysobacter]|uniref:EF-hand domain-containing protein n=1 Tax=unclassified Lysobacter TaxID=2635362 RepID=UPI001F5931E5|nr:MULTISPECIES: EF-hand domain-containing protein [unclassified Lysobacter]